MRDRLIELISQVQYMGGLEGQLADHLLAEGVIVPPCKVGSIVYTISRKHLKKWKVCFIGYNSQGKFKMHIATEKFTEMLEVWDYNIGKTVFLTRSEAEQALAERRGE
jgi:hypothetical protein